MRRRPCLNRRRRCPRHGQRDAGYGRGRRRPDRRNRPCPSYPRRISLRLTARLLRLPLKGGVIVSAYGVHKLKRKVLAPYRVKGQPKDWKHEGESNYRFTHPSNIWTDLTVPFWSMPENTSHPAQKPEKLFAKLVLASSRKNDFVFDPFAGSGTSVVVAEKLGRRWCGVDINSEYLCWARKRICAARLDPAIQGYSDGVFREINFLFSGQGRAGTAGFC